MTATARLCPSAEPGPQAVVIGVLQATAGEERVRPTKHAVPLSDELVDLVSPLPVTSVLRLAAPCLEGGCRHFDTSQDRCGLAAEIVEAVPTDRTDLPWCSIRPSCRWFAERGRDACRRCPQVMAVGSGSADAVRVAATRSAGPTADENGEDR